MFIGGVPVWERDQDGSLMPTCPVSMALKSGALAHSSFPHVPHIPSVPVSCQKTPGRFVDARCYVSRRQADHTGSESGSILGSIKYVAMWVSV